MNIISNNRCLIRVNECGDFDLSIASISGKFNPIILSTRDFIKLENYPVIHWQYDTVSLDLDEFINVMNQRLGSEVFSYDPNLKKVNSTILIEEMSPNFNNIIEFSSVSGPLFIFVQAEHLNTPMRFCNELIGDEYPAIVNIVSITLNTFAQDYPFVLGGVNTKINSQQLKNIQLRITDEFDNDILFISPILWSFNMQNLS
jgi:hypothetical protein